MTEGQFRQPFIHEAHAHLFGGSLKPQLPGEGQTAQTAIVEHDRIYPAIETRTRDVGTSIPHLIQLSEASKYTSTPVEFTSVVIEEEGGRVYHLIGHPKEHTWTVTTSDAPERSHKLNIEDTGPFVVGHAFTYIHHGEKGAGVTTRKIKHIKVVDMSHGKEAPKLGSGQVEDNEHLNRLVHAVRLDPHSKDPEHVQRTIKIADDADGVEYVAGYRQHERHEELHMHASRNELEIIEGYFEVCIFDREKWAWGEHKIYGPGHVFRLKPNTPHLVTPAQQPMHPNRLNIIKITTDRAANIDPGQGYNIPLPPEIPTELPPLDHHGWLRRAV